MSGMRMNKIYSLLYIVFFLILIGCSKNTEDHSIVNVGDQFEIRLHQKLTPTGGVPSFLINSLEPQDCVNSVISHQTIFSDSKIELFLNDIYVEGSCILGNEIIRDEILLETQKEAIPIEISLMNIISNNGILFADDSGFELELKQFDGLKISKTHINKIRPNLIWGSYTLSNSDLSNQIKQYFQSLDNSEPIQKGDFGFFYLAQDGSVSIYNNEGEISFLISTDESFDNFNSKIQDFKTIDESLVLQATNYDGSAINIH